MINSHPHVLVEISCAIVPPRITARLWMSQTISIDETPLAQPRECLPLTLRDVGSTMTRVRIPNINIFRRDIEIAPKRDCSVLLNRLIQPTAKPPKPYQLRFIKRR